MKRPVLKNRLRELREASGIYQRQIADYLKVTQQTYSRYESGEIMPPLRTYVLLAEFFNTSIDYLIYFTDVNKPYPRRKS